MARNRFYHRLRIAILLCITIGYVAAVVVILASRIPLFPKPDGDVDRQQVAQPQR